jgi:surfeit locus 1 family protein
MARYRFDWSLWPTVAAVMGIASTLALANWQLSRGHEKESAAARVASANRDAPIELGGNEVKADDVAWRRVEVRGTFAPHYMVLIDNRIFNGRVGYHVVMPIKIAGSERYALVNRGWIAANATRDALPSVKTPDGVVRITGLAMQPSRRYFELSSNVTEGKVWQNLTVERYRAAVPIAIQPVVIQQESALDDGLIREWPAPDVGIERHYSYALQWLALAVTILVFYVVTHVRKDAR